MAAVQRSQTVTAGASTLYRITPSGRAVAKWMRLDARNRHTDDLLDILHSSGHGVAEWQLRQFMPLETLMRTITSLLALGLIESNDGPRAQE